MSDGKLHDSDESKRDALRGTKIFLIRIDIYSKYVYFGITKSL